MSTTTTAKKIKQIFRGTVGTVPLNGGGSDTWVCAHKHKDVSTASRCAQMQLKRLFPSNSRDAVRFESSGTGVQVCNVKTDGQWVGLGVYRQYYGSLE